MSIATITSKGQVTLPKDVRMKLHLEVGERIDFQVDEEHGTATIIPLNKHIDDVFGILGQSRKKKVLPIEGMEKKIQQRFRREYS